MSESFPLGSLVRVSVTFKNQSDVDADPTAVSFQIIPPDGNDQTFTYESGSDPDGVIIKDSTGNYHADVNGSLEGKWSYRFSGTAPVQAADEGHFRIRESAFA
jgi:hypothetical protein